MERRNCLIQFYITRRIYENGKILQRTKCHNNSYYLVTIVRLLAMHMHLKFADFVHILLTQVVLKLGFTCLISADGVGCLIPFNNSIVYTSYQVCKYRYVGTLVKLNINFIWHLKKLAIYMIHQNYNSNKEDTRIELRWITLNSEFLKSIYKLSIVIDSI